VLAYFLEMQRCRYANGSDRQDEDLLSPAALELGPLPYIKRQAARKEEISMEGGTVVNAVEFSCTVLAPA
jgi:hypothetical protein